MKVKIIRDAIKNNLLDLLLGQTCKALPATSGNYLVLGLRPHGLLQANGGPEVSGDLSANFNVRVKVLCENYIGGL